MRLAILSDIHEDYESLLKIVGKAEARGFDKLICLGDISGFSLPYYKYGDSRNAPACLALLREKCDTIIAGNHDISAAGIDPELPDILKGQETWQHELDLDPGYSEEDISFLATLPYSYPIIWCEIQGIVPIVIWCAQVVSSTFQLRGPLHRLIVCAVLKGHPNI